jgi:zinc transport system ATP-binding protein
MTTVLAFDDVTFGYGRAPVLTHADLRVGAGEFVAVIGANGSGKTTLMRLGLGLEHAQSGTVSLFGTPVGRFHDWHRVGYVPQRAGVGAAIPLSVEEVVRSGLAARVGPLRRPTAGQRDRLAHVLELTGLARLRSHPMGRLSGGQQQRALIARALVTGPELLVLDEPTTGVDADARVSLRESLQHLVQVEGVAVVYVSHDPEGFAGLADRVVEVRAGQVLPCDDPSAHGHGHHGPGGRPGGNS